MNTVWNTDLNRIPESGQVVTALHSARRNAAATRSAVADSATGSASSAQIIPFASAALAQQRHNDQHSKLGALLGQSAAFSTALTTLENSNAASAAAEMQLLDATLDALATNSFEVYFQTQHCLRTNQVIGAEALLRLADEQGRLYNTQALIDLAERFDLVGLIGRQVHHKACSDFAQLLAEGKLQGRLALNVSALELQHAGYAEALLNTIVSTGLTPADIELEITETQSLDLPGVKLEQLLELANAGVDLAVDDFGTGYASWSTVARLPIRSVKLDRGMIAPVMECGRTQSLIRNMVVCGVDMGFRVVAEGVQSQAQQDLLVSLGCTVGQGFGLSVPKPARGFSA